MLTKEDIQKLKEELATKKDLKDLKQEVIEAGMEVFATKEDLEATSANLLNEIFTNRKDLGDFKKEMRKNFSDLQTSVDA